MKKVVLLLLVVLVLLLSMVFPAFAADRTTKEYWLEFFRSGKEVTAEMARTMTAEENLARMDALSELNAQNNKPTAVADDAAAIIARIKETYGISVELGYNGSYEAGAKVTQHLQGIEAGLSYLGSTAVKKLAKNVEDTQGLKFEFQLVPRLDTKSASGKQETSWASTGVGGITFFAYDSSPITAKMTVHEFGHLLCSVAHGGAGAEFAPFNNRDGVTYGEGAGAGYTIKSYATDRYVTAYAATKSAEDYAETFMCAIMGGTKTPLTYGKTTVVWKKVKVIYDDLVTLAGVDARATQRVGGYLGLVP